MKRALIAAVLVLLFNPIQAQAHHMPGPCDIHWSIPWRRHHNVEPIKDLIRCAVHRWPVSGGTPRALSVASCESHFRPDAYGNGNGGVFQHRLPYWQGRFDAQPTWWRLKPNIYNGRTNVIVSIRMAHASGWSAWSC